MFQEDEEGIFVTSAKYNYNGTEILALYNYKYLYLFNRLIMSSRGDYGHMYQNDMSSSSRLYIKSNYMILQLHYFLFTITVKKYNF